VKRNLDEVVILQGTEEAFKNNPSTEERVDIAIVE
jgi:hypothetical protein